MKRFYLTRKLALPAIFTLFSVAAWSQNAWINEFHYDNTSIDVGEFIEVVLQDAGDYNLADFSVVLYNGSPTARSPYDTKTLDQFSPGATVGSFSTLCYTFPSNGIQNGAPDGLALVYTGSDPDTVLQFLSYEGSFIAAIGPAVGMTSIDIGVSEIGIEPVGMSLQLQGEGSYYSDFFWVGPLTASNCTFNTGQTMVEIVVTPLSDWAIVLGVLLIGLFAFLRIRRNS
jgi:uncharacterized protein